MLNELGISDFQWVPSSGLSQATAAGEVQLTATPQSTADLGHDATPWMQYDVLQLATTVAAAIAASTARNEEFARPFAHAPAAMQAEEVPHVLDSVGISPRVCRCFPDDCMVSAADLSSCTQHFMGFQRAGGLW